MSTTGHAIHQLVGKRQVHLDFHTSEHLFDIGNKFSKEQFQSTLKLAHVDAVNLFAKCHHSWFYYPTKAGNIHPNLNFDLLGSQIEACKEIGVKVPGMVGPAPLHTLLVAKGGQDLEHHRIELLRALDHATYL